MPTPQYSNYIAQITLPDNVTYHIKDSEARQWIEDMVSGGLTFVIAWDGASTPVPANIPAGATVTYQGTTYTGTLVASATTKSNIYLVHSDRSSGRDIYEEYVTVNFGSASTPSYGWEVLGNTDISLDALGALAWKDSVTLNKGSGDTVLGASTTFTAAASSVTWTPYTETINKTYGASTSKLETASITGVAGEVTFSAVNTNTSVTATNTVFGTDTTASKVTTESKTATNTVFGTATTASKAMAGNVVQVAKPASSATNVSYVGSSTTSSLLETATVTDETLIIGSVSVTQSSVTGTNGSQSYIPYTFTDVTVPVVSSNSEVTVASVKTNTDVTVPVVTSNAEVTATNTTITSKTAATKAANATTVATGSLNANDTVGATVATNVSGSDPIVVMTGLTGVQAAAQTITVGTNDQVSVAKYGDLSITVS